MESSVLRQIDFENQRYRTISLEPRLSELPARFSSFFLMKTRLSEIFAKNLA
jgi:hypothetical protein